MVCTRKHSLTANLSRPSPRICLGRALHCAGQRVNGRASNEVLRVTVTSNLAGLGWGTLKQVAALLAASFYEDDDAWYRGTAQPDGDAGLDAALFGWYSLVAVLLQHLLYGSHHRTLLASSPDGQVIGCCGLTLEAAPADVVEATGAPPDCKYALLTGLAVAPQHRRQGVGSRLLEGVAAVATVEWLPPPVMVALLVARTNTAAIRLYERHGFKDQPSWTDARWLAEAERGKVGKPRRLLMVRQLGAVDSGLLYGGPPQR